MTRTALTTCLLAALWPVFSGIAAGDADPTGVCGVPGQSCFVAGPNPGCDDEECCKTVCGFDAFCCNVAWDSVCADAASVFCVPVACPVCWPRLVPESEPCGASSNPGCDAGAFSLANFSTEVVCGEGICGTLWAEGGVQDTDWYWFDLPDPAGDGMTSISVCVGGSAPTTFELFEAGSFDCGLLSPVWSASVNACDSYCTLEFCVPAGPHVLKVALGTSLTTPILQGYPCFGTPAEYAFSLESCTDVCDCDGDGVPDSQEIDTDGDGIPDDCDPCFLACPPGATPEADPCGTETNGGCNFTPALFDSISCGETICGTAWAENSTRDMDWYEFYVTGPPCDVHFSVHAEFEAVGFIIDGSGGCGAAPTIVASSVAACTTATWFATLPPGGPYWFVVAPSVFDGYPCGSGNNGYTVTLTCGCSDCDGDGIPDSQESDPWCCQCICLHDPYCCEQTWDSICAAAAQIACDKDCNINGTLDTLDVLIGASADCNANCVPDECEAPCAWNAGSGTCMPTCTARDPDCCACLGGVDPFCCEVAWDSLCFGLYEAICNKDCNGNGVFDTTDVQTGTSLDCNMNCIPDECETLGALCSAGDTPENEPCGTFLNDGCNLLSGPPQFGSISCGETICGNAWAEGGTRDTDWYEFCLSDWTDVTFTASAQFAFVVGLVNTGGVPDCMLATGLSNFDTGDATNPVSFTISIPAGTHWLFFAPTAFYGLPCVCPGQYRVTLDVNPLPSPPTNVFATDPAICVGESTELKGTVGANETIVWHTGSCTGPVAGTGSPLTVSPTTSTTYYAGASLGCFGCPSACVAVTVTVDDPPMVAVAGDTDVCVDDSVSLTAQATPTSTFEWFAGTCANPGAQKATTAGYSPPSTTAGTFLYHVVATDPVTGCTTCEDVTVTVSDPPMVAIAGDTDVCVDDTVALTAQVTPATPTATYKWFEGTCANPGAQKATTAVYSPPSTTAGTFLYHVVVTIPGSDCKTCEDVTVTVSDPPMVAVAGDTDVCVDDTVALTAQVTPATPTATYKWFEGTCANPGAQKATTAVYSPPSTTAGTFLYHVVVTIPGSDCKTCEDVTVTVSDPPMVAIAGDTDVCVDDTVALTAQVTPATPTATYKWFEGTCANPGAQKATTAIYSPPSTTAGTFLYHVVVTVPGSDCTTCEDVTVTVSDPPMVAIAGDTDVCVDDTVALTAQVTPATPTATYKWFEGTCANPGAQKATTAVYSPPSTTAGTFLYHVVVTIPGSDCKTCEDVTVTVSDPPMVAVAGDTDVCVDDTVALTAQVTPATPTATYKWFEGTCANPGAQKATTAVYSPPSTTAGTFLYHVVVTDPVTGCTACEDVTVVVHDPPTLAVSANQSVCVDDTVSLTATTPVAAADVEWYAGSCPVSGSSLATGYTFSPGTTAAGTFTYSVVATDPVTGCKTCKQVTVAVHDPPTLAVSANQSVCVDDTVSLGATTLVPAGDVKWYAGSCPVSGTSLATGYSYSPSTTVAGTVTYSVVATDPVTGCTACEDVTVTVSDPPTLAVSANQSVCENDLVTLTATASVAAQYISWGTTCKGTALATGASFQPSTSTVGTTTYFVWAKDPTTNCESACETVMVTVNAGPAAPTSASASDPVICQGQSTTLTASGGSGTTLEWFVGSCPTGAATAHMTGSSITVAPTQTTTYHVRWTNSCGESGCEEVTVTVIPTCPPAAVQKVWFVIYGTSTGSPWDWEITGTTFKIGGTVTPSSGDTAKMMADLLALSVAEVGKCGPLAEGCGTLAPAQVCVYVNSSCPDRAVINIRACEVVTLCVKDTATPTACCPIMTVAGLGQACSTGFACQVNPSFFMLETEGLDCNQNEIDDGIDILLGTSEDANGDSIPDECDACLGDLNLDGAVDGADLGLVLGAWGSDGVGTGADLNGDDVVDGADLGLILGAWGECASPCLGDLNLDGTVDGADLGLVLGAWGTDGAATGADLNDDDVVDGADLGLLLGAWGACQSGAPAALFAYEGFDYHPAGDDLSAYPDGGVGWLGHWLGESTDPWDVFAPGLSYSDAEGNVLVVGGSRIQGRSARSLHTLDLDGGPLGDAQGTLWISMLVEASATESDGSWMGLSLPAAGPHPFLFLGKPREMPTWAIDNGVAGDALASRVPSRELAFLVLRIDFREGPDDVALWVNPSLEGEPALESADVWAPHYGDFVGITQVRVDVGATQGEFSGSIDEIRLGSTYRDVAPIDRGSRSDAVQRALEASKPHDPTMATSAASDKKR